MLVFQGSIHSNIQITKGVNIHNNIQEIILKDNLQKISDFLPYQNFFYNNKIQIISRKFIIDTSTINQLN